MMNLTTQRRLVFSFALTFFILAAEVIGGVLSNSLALLSDAGHVLTDAFALGLSLAALKIGQRPADYRATFGYQRVGLLAAMINGASLVVIAIFILIEAYRRIKSPPEIGSSVMLAVAAAGLLGNLAMALVLGARHHDLNMKSVWLHVLGDTLSSVGVIAAALIIKLTGWGILDPIVSVLVGLIVIMGGWRVIKEALWIFLELSPAGFHAEDISDKISKLPGVRCVHDVHVWSIGHGVPAFSAHVQVDDQKISEADAVRKEIEGELARIGIQHSVIQMECAQCNENGLYCPMQYGHGHAGHMH
ncbi:MAG: cation diffusion facilitator family transporter [Desulfobacteraceae bacterium]|nr:cation diffusion facilitator family transporter [Desulfobacteraceae bacterium]